MTKNNELNKLGSAVVLTVAELKDLQNPANKHGDTRVGGTGLGKHIGMEVLIDTGNTSTETMGDALGQKLYKRAMALGEKSSDPWQDLADAAALIVPTNVDDPDNTDTTWTLTTATYADGLLTASGAANVNAAQTITGLAAGTYRLDGTVNRAATPRAVKLVVTGATDGIVLEKIFEDAVVSTDDSEVDNIDGVTFTLTETQDVDIEMNIVAISNEANDTGGGRLRFILESM